MSISSLVDLFEAKAAPPNAKLGYKPGPPHKNEVELGRYDLRKAANSPQVPKQIHRSFRNYPWGMLLNDQIGDCGPVMLCHADEQQQLTTGVKPKPYTDETAQKIYEITGGYRAGDPNTDNGTDWTSLATYWQNIGIEGSKISGSANVDTSNLSLVDRAIWEFDSLLWGVQLPITAQSQRVWDVVNVHDGSDKPGSWGGHWVSIFSFDGKRFAFCSWGQIMMCTIPFFLAYGVPAVGGEGHVVVSNRMIQQKSGKSVAGFNLPQLAADLGVA